MGLFMGVKARGAMARGRAIDKRKLAARQADARSPYAAIKTAFDRYLLALDKGKAQITDAAQIPKISHRAYRSRLRQHPQQPAHHPAILL